MFFRRKTLRALAAACRQLRHLRLADSVGIDYHKTSFGTAFPAVALKSYILSPFVDEDHVEAVVRKVLEAREKVKPV